MNDKSRETLLNALDRHYGTKHRYTTSKDISDDWYSKLLEVEQKIRMLIAYEGKPVRYRDTIFYYDDAVVLKTVDVSQLIELD